MAALSRQPAAEMGIGDWWNSFQRSGHQERARQHKMQAVHHENELKKLERSAIDLGGWNPLTAMAKSHHRRLAEHHRAKQDYHESHASDRMTGEEKRDAQGRWTAAFSHKRKGKAMSRRQHYEARRARQMAMGLAFGPDSRGGVACAVDQNFRQVAFKSAEALTQFLKQATAEGLAVKKAGELTANIAGFSEKSWPFIMKLCNSLGGIFKNRIASFSCPPKFHKLYAGFSMSDDGKTVMKDGKPCSSRRGRYFKKRHAAMTSPDGQVPSSNPDYGNGDVLP